MDNYEKAKENIRPEFLKYDQEAMIRRFQLAHDGFFLYLDFCGKTFRINRTSGMVEKPAGSLHSFQDGAAPADFTEALSLYDMLCYSKPGAVLSGRWCQVNRLPGVGQNQGLGDRLTNGEAEAIDRHPEAFRLACAALGGQEVDLGDMGYQIPVFPFFPVRLRFYHSDLEFPPQLTMLFDENTLDFLHYETTYYVRSCLLQAILKKMEAAPSV